MADFELLNFTTEQGLRMFDALSRTASSRQIKPLDQIFDYIEYDHRYLYDSYNLMIGDVYMMIPPEFIYVASESYSQQVQTLRQENSQKQKTGYHKRTIKIDLVFDGMDEINGYKVPGPTHKDGDKYSNFYYVDGLRTLLAQFKYTPFLPIENDLLNNAYKIYVVALQSIVIRTIDGFQNALNVQLTLQEMDMMPYIEMPNLMFKHVIDWDLLRYYIQGFLTDQHEYRKFQALPENKDHTAFKLSILKEECLQTVQTDAEGNKTAKTVGDKKSGKTKEQTVLEKVIDPDNYDCLVNSEESDVHITAFQCGYANMLTSIQMSDASSPTLQYLGGLDTGFSIIFETTDVDVIGAIEQCQIQNDLMVRNNPKIRGSIGFVKVEADFVTFCGSLFCTIESVETHTVQGVPGLYQVKLSCVSYDIAQSRREELNGFLPFDGRESNIEELALYGKELEEITTDLEDIVAPNKEQAIEQSYVGLMKKIYQDNYAEWKLRTSMEVYPDLRLPTYAEINEAIKNINAFRKANNLPVLPYTEYPVQSTNMMFGDGAQRQNFANTWADSNPGEYNVVHADGYDATQPIGFKVPGWNNRDYMGFVDPDFYVFYPNTYLSIYQEEKEASKQRAESTGTEEDKIYSDPYQFNNVNATVTTEKDPVYADGTGNKISGFIGLLRNLEGCSYRDGSEGNFSDYKGPQFDDLGLITCGLKQMGVIPGNNKILKYGDFSSMDIFQEVSPKEVKRGDIVTDSTFTNCGVYIGLDKNNNNTIITSLQDKGVTETNSFWTIAHAYRIIPLQPNSKTQGTSQSNPYESGESGYPDANKSINKKQPSALETTEGYSSANPYGADNAAYTSKEEMDEAKKNEYDKENRETTADELADVTAKPELQQADISELIVPQIEDDGSQWTDGSVEIEYELTMTIDEYDSLARIVATQCEGETLESKMAMSQYLYDSIIARGNGYGFSTVIKEQQFIRNKEQIEERDLDEAKACIQRVFVVGMRWKVDYEVLAVTDMNNSNYGSMEKSNTWEFIDSIGQHNYYGISKLNKPSELPGLNLKPVDKGRINHTISYEIKDYGVSNSSSHKEIRTEEKEGNAVNVDDGSVSGFGKPIYIKPSHFDTHDGDVGEEWQKLNSDRNRIFTSFVDDCQYSAKGKFIKAFPAFLFCILDENSQWFDGKKLWTNYYVYKPVVDIQYHAANDMPTSTAQITVTNTYHNLDRSSAALIKYSIDQDDDYCWLNRQLYKYFGMVAGGLKITNRLIQMHSIIYTHTRVREGARVHLRMGYGSDPLSLAPVINGTISAMTLGDQISITITSDGHELIQNVTSDKSKDLNNGALALYGLGATQEASNIITKIMVKRESWINHLWFAGNWYEGSKYNIEHYGLYINSGEQYSLQGGIDTGIYEQYDLLQNIYTASTSEGWFNSYRHWSYIYDHPTIMGRDGESNIVFNQYNMTPWDVFQLCAQTTPEFLVKPEMYQFDSRLFFGLPFDLIKYRYDIINGTIYQECKSNTQMHYIDSISSIIENQVSVTSRHSFTNAKVIYIRGSSPTSTPVIHSDDTIDHSKQSTHIIDSCIAQDYLGIDAVNEFFGIKHGKESARKLGISNLLYGWQQQYQGQLLCLGMPHIRPDDWLMVNDFYTTLNGLSMVREVIHSFNTNTGFTTSIIPGIIGFCPEMDSGNVVLAANFLNLYSMFTEYSQSRKIIKENCERFASVYATLDKCVKDVSHKSFFYNAELWESMHFVSKTAEIAALSVLVYKAIRCIKLLGGLIEAIKTIAAVYKALKVLQATMKGARLITGTMRVIQAINIVSKGISAAEGVIAAAETAEAGILTAGAATSFGTYGISLAVAVIITIIIEIVMNLIMEWVENRNVCVLLPLWWEGEPFISGINQGEKILLIPSSATASLENTGEEGFESDEDEETVEDN